ncbi:hypothetical protein FA13DRAFT_1802149 [Coprinellus micaceus]|uniref:HMG domain-containing protein n=1 Tax=Coprinellus micaceus TaxID=71717 RepID=A0A4Y7SCQ4_COPMI|nr:hypothetical protein FA13DRAFT_1802149 [Coprinellus micaceus]
MVGSKRRLTDLSTIDDDAAYPFLPTGSGGRLNALVELEEARSCLYPTGFYNKALEPRQKRARKLPPQPTVATPSVHISPPHQPATELPLEPTGAGTRVNIDQGEAIGTWDDLGDVFGGNGGGCAQVNDGIQPVSKPAEITEAHLASYLDAVNRWVSGLSHIDGPIFAIEGWDLARQRSTGTWYHIQYIFLPDTLNVVCTCPPAVKYGHCVHELMFRHYDVQKFAGSVDTRNFSGTRVVMFLRQPVPNTSDSLTMFSVAHPDSPFLKERALVTHIGPSPTHGEWRCSKDAGGHKTCTHVSSAQRALCGALEIEWIASTTEENEDGGRIELVAAEPVAALPRQGAVSYRPVLPPRFITLKTDPVLYERPPPYRSPPAGVIPLDTASSCPCPSTKRATVRGDKGSEVKDCRVWTAWDVYEAKVQLQRCPNCFSTSRRYIGPDLREVGLFNYNNTTIVSHELLDDYTIMFTTSETPFTSFCTFMNHRFGEVPRPPNVPRATFMGEDLFRSVWFAYVLIQSFEKDMLCTLCGPHPKTVIWDGVTLAFDKSTSPPPSARQPLPPLTPFDQGRIPLLHRKFFLEIVAEESVLQLVNGKALIRLKQFLTPPNAQDSVSLINGIPAFYHLYHIHPNPLALSPHI